MHRTFFRITLALSIAGILSAAGFLVWKHGLQPKPPSSKQEEAALPVQVAEPPTPIAQEIIPPEPVIALKRIADRVKPPLQPIEPPYHFGGLQSLIHCAAFNADGSLLATCGFGGSIHIWDAGNRRLLRTFDVGKTNVDSLFFSPDGKELASLGTDVINPTLSRWNVLTGDRIATYTWPYGNPKYFCIDYREAGKLVGLKRNIIEGMYQYDLWHVGGTLVGFKRTWIEGRQQYQLWDIAAQKEIATVPTLPEGGGGITNLKFAQRSTATGHYILWDILAGKEKARLSPGISTDIAWQFSPDGRRFVIVGSRQQDERGKKVTTNFVQSWDVATGTKLAEWAPTDGNAVKIAFSADSEMLAMASYVSDPATKKIEVAVWDAARGKQLRKTELPGIQVTQLHFHPDGASLLVLYLSGGDSYQLAEWEIATGINHVYPGHPYVQSVAYSPDGKRIATGGWKDGTVQIWDVATGQNLARWTIGQDTEKLIWSRNGRWIALALRNGTVALLDSNTGKIEVAFPLDGGTVHSVAISADDTLLAGGNDANKPGKIRVWNLLDANLGEASSLVEEWETFHTVWEVSLSPDGRLLASAEGYGGLRRDSGCLKIYDVQTGRIFRGFVEPGLNDLCVQFSPDGQKLAWSNTRQIKVWDRATDKVTVLYPPQDQKQELIGSLAFSPGGTMLAVTSSSLRFIDVGTGKLIEERKDESGSRIVFDPMGKTIAYRSEKTVRPNNIRIIPFPEKWQTQDRERAVAIAADNKNAAEKRASEKKAATDMLAARIKAAADQGDLAGRTAETKKSLLGTWHGKQKGKFGSQEIDVGIRYEFMPDGKWKGSVQFPEIGEFYDAIIGARLNLRSQQRPIQGTYALLDVDLIKMEAPDERKGMVTSYGHIHALDGDRLHIEWLTHKDPKTKDEQFTRKN